MDTRNDFSTTSTTPPVVAYHDSATKLAVAPQGPHLIVRYDETGEAASVIWHTAYGDPAFESLRLMARSRQGKWTGDGWTFSSSEQLRRFLATSRAIRSGWPQIDQHSYSPRLQVTEFADSHLLLWAPVSEIAKSTHGKNAFDEVEKIAATDKWSFKTVVLGVRRAFFLLTVVGPAVDSRADRLAKIKARIGANDEALPWLAQRPVRLECKGWMLSMEFDVRDPRHLLVMASFVRAPDRRGTLSDHELEPVITIDRSIWPKAAKLLGEHGIALIGDSPTQPLHRAVCMHAAPPGWDKPAHNGHLLRHYQRDAVEFLLNRGFRAILGDEMGLGKTAQVIAAIEAAQIERVLIIAPLAARYVWDAEIRAWSVAGERAAIAHIVSGDDYIPPNARWVIVSYDLLAEREGSWIVLLCMLYVTWVPMLWFG